MDKKLIIAEKQTIKVEGKKKGKRLFGSCQLCLSDCDRAEKNEEIVIEDFVIDNGYTGYLALPNNEKTQMLKSFSGIKFRGVGNVYKGEGSLQSERYFNCWARFKSQSQKDLVSEWRCLGEIVIADKLQHPSIGIMGIEELEIEFARDHQNAFILLQEWGRAWGDVPNVSTAKSEKEDEEEKIEFHIPKNDFFLKKEEIQH